MSIEGPIPVLEVIEGPMALLEVITDFMSFLSSFEDIFLPYSTHDTYYSSYCLLPITLAYFPYYYSFNLGYCSLVLGLTPSYRFRAMDFNSFQSAVIIHGYHYLHDNYSLFSRSLALCRAPCYFPVVLGFPFAIGAPVVVLMAIYDFYLFLISSFLFIILILIKKGD